MYSYDQIQLEFLEQCMMGDEWKIRNMLRTGHVDTSYKHNLNGWTSLHWAANRGHESICLLLLDSGYSRDSLSKDGKIPYDVCPVSNQALREILRPETSEEKIMKIESENKNIANESEMESGDTKFIPNYVRNPAFPYTTKTKAFDSVGPTPASPTSPTKNGSYYSYGRRDSVNRTRFLLVRTSCGAGKEAFKRITLPGGSTVDQLKKTIEAAMKTGVVSYILTLPDKVLVEEDSQIAGFGDCQKIDVIFESTEEKEKTPQPIGDSGVSSPTSSTCHSSELRADIMDSENTEASNPHPHQSDFIEESSNANADEVHSGDMTPAEDDSVFAVPVTEELAPEQEEEQSRPTLGVRRSMDSETGEYVKVEADEDSMPTKLFDSIPVDMSIIDPKSASGDHEQAVLPAEPNATIEPAKEIPAVPCKLGKVVEQSKKNENNGLAKWIEENPDTVRTCATVAAVAGVASLGAYIYMRKYK